MKKILILYATYGSGHKTIAEYIKSYFEQNGNYECLLVDLISYGIPIIGNLSKKTTEFFMTKLPFIWSFIYFSFDNKLSAYIFNNASMFLLKSKKLQKIIKDFNPDITIATHFFGTDLINKYNKKGLTNSKIVTIVTDYHAHNFWLSKIKCIDAIIVSSIEEKFCLLKKGFKNKQIYTSGIPICPKIYESVDKEKLLKKFKIYNNNKNILFFVGGGNGALNNLIYFKEILKNNYDCNVLFIAGKNKKAYSKAKEYVKKYNSSNVRLYGYVTNVNEFYMVSDFVVTKPGGAQITECLYFNKPMLLVKSNGGQEIANRKVLCHKGYAKWGKNKKAFNSYYKLMLDDNYLSKMCDNISKIDHKLAMEKLFKIVNKM